MTWSAAPTLVGSLVTLEALRPDHAPGVLAAADDDSVFAHGRYLRPTTLAEAAALVASYLARDDRACWAQLVDGEVAGLTTVYDISPADRTVSIGSTWIGTRWQRTGVNREAKLLLLMRAFEELGCVRVVWHVDERNDASRAAVLSLGATQEGLLRKHKQRRDGSWRTTVQFAMTDDDWPAVKARLSTGCLVQRVR